MKTFPLYKLLLASICFLCLSLSSCTQADGYIGPWFGSWHIEKILLNGEADKEYKENLMISFQGKIFKLGYLDSAEIFGSWEYEGEILTLDAGYNAGNGAGMDHLFNPFPPALHFPADVSQIEITVTSINSKTMQWQYIDQEGDLVTYNLRKYP